MLCRYKRAVYRPAFSLAKSTFGILYREAWRCFGEREPLTPCLSLPRAPQTSASAVGASAAPPRLIDPSSLGLRNKTVCVELI